MPQDNFRDRFRSGRGVKKSSESNGMEPEKSGPSAAHSVSRSISKSFPQAKRASIPLPKRPLYLAALGFLLVVCLLTLVFWDSFFGFKVPVVTSPPNYSSDIANLLGDIHDSKDAIDRLKKSGHIKQTKASENNIVDDVVEAVVSNRTWKTDEKGGGAARNLWVFYVNNYFLLDPKGKVLLVGTKGNNPFGSSSPSNKTTIELHDFLEKLADGIKNGGLAIVALDLHRTTKITNFAYMKFPTDEITKAFESLTDEQKGKLLVILPCKSDQRSWLSANYHRSYFGTYFLHGVATGFGKNASLDFFKEELGKRIANDVRSKFGASAEQIPAFLYDDKQIDLKNYSLFGWYGATDKSDPPKAPIDDEYENLGKLWENFRRKYQTKALWKLSWKEHAEKLNIEAELASFESLYDYGSASNIRMQQLKKRLDPSDQLPESTLEKDVEEFLKAGASEEGIEKAWLELSKIAEAKSPAEKAITKDNARDEALRTAIKVLCFELNNSSSRVQGQNKSVKTDNWKAVSNILSNYLDIQKLSYDTNPGFFQKKEHTSKLSELTKAFMHSVDCAISFDFSGEQIKSKKVKELHQSLKKVRDDYHVWIDNTRNLSSMIPTCLSLQIERSKVDSDSIKLVAELADALNASEELRHCWENEGVESYTLHDKVADLKDKVKNIQEKIIGQLKSYEGKSIVGENAINLRATLRCPDLPQDTRKKYHQELKTFWESSSNTNPSFTNDTKEHRGLESAFLSSFKLIQKEFINKLSSDNRRIFENVFQYDIRFDKLGDNASERLWQQLAIGDTPWSNQPDVFDLQDKKESIAYRQWQFDRYCLERWGDPTEEKKSTTAPFKMLANSFNGGKDLMDESLRDAEAALEFNYDPQAEQADYPEDKWSADGDRFALIRGEIRKAIDVPFKGPIGTESNDSTGTSESLLMAIRGHRKVAELDTFYKLNPTFVNDQDTSITVRPKAIPTSITILLDCSKSMGIKSQVSDKSDINFNKAKNVVRETIKTIATIAEENNQEWDVSLVLIGYDPKEAKISGLTRKNGISSIWHSDFIILNKPRVGEVSNNKPEVQKFMKILDSLRDEHLGGTPLLEAVRWATDSLKKSRYKGDEQKLILVISDGADDTIDSQKDATSKQSTWNELKRDRDSSQIKLLFYPLELKEKDKDELKKIFIKQDFDDSSASGLAKTQVEKYETFLREIGVKPVSDFDKMLCQIKSQFIPEYSLVKGPSGGQVKLKFPSDNKPGFSKKVFDPSVFLDVDDPVDICIKIGRDDERPLSRPFPMYRGQNVIVGTSLGKADPQELEVSFLKEFDPVSKGYTALFGGSDLQSNKLYYNELTPSEGDVFEFVLDQAGEATKPVIRPKHFVGIYRQARRVYFFSDPIYQPGHFLPTIRFANFKKLKDADPTAQAELLVFTWDEFDKVRWVDPSNLQEDDRKKLEGDGITFQPKPKEEASSRFTVDIEYKKTNDAGGDSDFQQRWFVLVENSRTKILDRWYYEKPVEIAGSERQFHREKHDFELPAGARLGFVQAKDLLSDSAKGQVKRWTNKPVSP
jgi:hypothetical protein